MTSLEGRARGAYARAFRLHSMAARYRESPTFAVLNGPLMAHHLGGGLALLWPVMPACPADAGDESILVVPE
jgi:hypothetical protein